MSKARKWRAKKGTEWEQIGQIQWETKTTFEGNNHTIIGIYIIVYEFFEERM